MLKIQQKAFPLQFFFSREIYKFLTFSWNFHLQRVSSLYNFHGNFILHIIQCRFSSSFKCSSYRVSSKTIFFFTSYASGKSTFNLFCSMILHAYDIQISLYSEIHFSGELFCGWHTLFFCGVVQYFFIYEIFFPNTVPKTSWRHHTSEQQENFFVNYY